MPKRVYIDKPQFFKPKSGEDVQYVLRPQPNESVQQEEEKPIYSKIVEMLTPRGEHQPANMNPMTSQQAYENSLTQLTQTSPIGIPVVDSDGDDLDETPIHRSISNEFNVSPETAKNIYKNLSVYDEEGEDPDYNKAMRDLRSKRFDVMMQDEDISEEDKKGLVDYHNTQHEFDEAY